MRGAKWLVAVFAALVGGMLSTTTAAVPGSTKSTTTQPANANVAALHKAHKLLETALHDYDGHRGKAAHLVKEAIHELSGNHQAKTKAAGAGANKNAPAAAQANANKETQAQSDEQLTEAIKILTAVEGNLGTSHPKAAEHIKEAIAELNTALKIK
jgi:hypothetical protein